MTDADVLDVTVDMIWCIIKCSAPLLLVLVFLESGEVYLIERIVMMS